MLVALDSLQGSNTIVFHFMNLIMYQSLVCKLYVFNGSLIILELYIEIGIHLSCIRLGFKWWGTVMLCYFLFTRMLRLTFCKVILLV